MYHIVCLLVNFDDNFIGYLVVKDKNTRWKCVDWEPMQSPAAVVLLLEQTQYVSWPNVIRCN